MMMSPRLLVVFALLLSFSTAPAAEAYILLVESKECLTSHVDEGQSITGSFVVLDVDSAWSDDHGTIDFWIDGPNNYRLYSARQRSEDHFQVAVAYAGDYSVCLENTEHMAATVEVNFHVGEPVPKIEEIAKDDHMKGILDLVQKIKQDLVVVQQDQAYFKARDLRRRKTNESTRGRLLWYTVLEALVLMAACGAQVYVLHKLFERGPKRFAAGF